MCIVLVDVVAKVYKNTGEYPLYFKEYVVVDVLFGSLLESNSYCFEDTDLQIVDVDFVNNRIVCLVFFGEDADSVVKDLRVFVNEYLTSNQFVNSFQLNSKHLSKFF